MNGCFLYIIVTAHYIKYGSEFVQLLGYGITINPKKRSKQYSDHTGVEQEFCYLFYGQTMHIKALESIIKQRVASKCHKIYGEPVEWVSPKAKMTVDEMVTLVKDTIDQQGFPIKMLKDDFLPFNNLEHHRKITVKELNANPDLYLV
jgi:hypothetical protein